MCHCSKFMPFTSMRMMRFSWMILVMVLVLAACVSGNSAPKDNAEFALFSDLREIQGVYKNAGEPGGYLSAVIWGPQALKRAGAGQEVPHEDIDLIQVLAAGNALTVNAIKDGCVLHPGLYQAGRDFTFSKWVTGSSGMRLILRALLFWSFQWLALV